MTADGGRRGKELNHKGTETQRWHKGLKRVKKTYLLSNVISTDRREGEILNQACDKTEPRRFLPSVEMT
jgi:hypothetical protein